MTGVNDNFVGHGIDYSLPETFLLFYYMKEFRKGAGERLEVRGSVRHRDGSPGFFRMINKLN